MPILHVEVYFKVGYFSIIIWGTFRLLQTPEEAEIVKRIYREYLEGSSMLKIARGLEADGILNGAGNEKWHTSNINNIY
jgi:DNA invertase Pin-like site-specific DNA recombinase